MSVRARCALQVRAPAACVARVIGLLVLLCACAGRQAEPTLAPDGELPPRDAGQRCSRERVPGSHIRQEVCRGSEQGGADRDATERLLRRPAPAEPMAE